MTHPGEQFDAIVIGAGVIGAGVALELARHGRNVAVVDRHAAAGAGSTSASSAIVRFNYSTFEGVAVAWEAKQCWADWEGHLGHVDPTGMVSFIPTGGLVMDFPGFRIEHELEMYERAGIPAERLSPDQIAHRFPYLDPGRHHPPRRLDDDAFWDDADGLIGAFYTPEGGFVSDPSQAAHNLLHAAVMEGATTVFGATVVGIPRDVSRVTGVRLADGRALRAPIVVNVAGPHSAVINELAGVLEDFRITTRPLRQEVHQVPGPAAYRLSSSMPTPFVADSDLGTYFRPEPGGQVLVGSQEPECDPLHWLDDADDHDPAPTQAIHEAQATRLARRMPDAQVPNRPRGVVGVYDVTEDWIPIYDRTSLDGFYVAIGTSGNQFKNAPVVGQMLRALIDACEAGHDHDADPVVWHAPRTGLDVDLGHYSRRREVNADSSFSVMG